MVGSNQCFLIRRELSEIIKDDSSKNWIMMIRTYSDRNLPTQTPFYNEIMNYGALDQLSNMTLPLYLQPPIWSKTNTKNKEIHTLISSILTQNGSNEDHIKKLYLREKLIFSLCIKDLLFGQMSVYKSE